MIGYSGERTSIDIKKKFETSHVIANASLSVCESIFRVSRSSTCIGDYLSVTIYVIVKNAR